MKTTTTELSQNTSEKYRIFIVGGTGVLGKRLVPQLVEKGHDVSVLSRSTQKSEWIRNQGANAIEVDLFDLEDLKRKAVGFEIYIHMATSIPTNTRPKKKDWEMNARLRSEGVDNLMTVAKMSDSKLFIKESINFHYGHRPNRWLNEESKIIRPIPTNIKISEDLNEVVLVNAYEMEQKLLREYQENYFPVIILRFGWLYSHDSSILDIIADRKMPVIGKGDAYWSMITVDDAANSIAKTIENYKNNIGEIFNIVDDEPVQAKEFMNYGSQIATGKSPIRVPVFLAKLFAGSYIVNFATSSRKIENNKAKEQLNWIPNYPTYREGLEHEYRLYFNSKKNPEKLIVNSN